MKYLLPVFLLVCCTSPLAAQNKAPQGPAPEMVHARLTENGELNLKVISMVTVQKTRTRNVTVTKVINGREVQETVPVTEAYVVQVPVSEERAMNAQGIQLLTLSGGPITTEQRRKLEKYTPVFLLRGNAKVDRYYQEFLSSKIPVVV